MESVSGALDSRAITHFVTSIVVCGTIAVAYPFFFVSFYMVRSIYPAFLPHGATDTTDARELEGLHRRSIRYLAVAAAVPLVAVAGSTFLTVDEIAQVQPLCVCSRWAASARSSSCTGCSDSWSRIWRPCSDPSRSVRTVGFRRSSHPQRSLLYTFGSSVPMYGRSRYRSS